MCKLSTHKFNSLLRISNLYTDPAMLHNKADYLNYRTCYDKIVCTILFSSKWWVYWYELFSILSTLQKWQKFWWNAKSIIRGFSSISGIFKQCEILISLECAFDSEWNGGINFVVSCSIAELFIHRNHQNQVFNGLSPHNNISTILHTTIYCLYHSVQLKIVSLVIWIV